MTSGWLPHRTSQSCFPESLQRSAERLKWLERSGTTEHYNNIIHICVHAVAIPIQGAFPLTLTFFNSIYASWKRLSLKVVLKVQAFSFNLRLSTSKSDERCRNYNTFYMCPSPFNGPKVIGQTNIIKKQMVAFSIWLQILQAEFVLLLLSTVTSSINIRESIPSAAIHVP